MTLQELLAKLETKIIDSYNHGVTITEAEKLAGEFLHGQLLISAQLKITDLDARMKKVGVKAIRADAYLQILKASEKKPTEAQISAEIDTDKSFQKEQELFDTAEVHRNELERLYEVYGNCHIYFRTIAKQGM